MSESRRVALVTGAGGFVGSALCAALSPTHDVIAAYRTEPPPLTRQDAWLFDPLRPTVVLTENAHPVFAVRADLSDPDDVERLVEVSVAHSGMVDLLVNNAADVTGASSLADPRLADVWGDQLLLNALSPVALAAALAQACWRGDERGNRRRRRNVVNVSSTAGLGSTPGRGRGVYGASKAALNVLTRQMAVEYGLLGVRVNAIAPTFVPQVVTLEAVVAVVREIDGSRVSGQVLRLGADGARPV